MAGGNGKLSKNNSRRGGSGRTLFVDGGFLYNGQKNPSLPRSPRGKISRENGKSASKSRKSDKQRTSASRDGARKPTGNAFGYEYPVLDVQELLRSESGVDGNTRSHPIVLLDSIETQVAAHVDETPCVKPFNGDTTYEYGSSFVLGGSCHRGLGFNDELEKTQNGIWASSAGVKEREGFEFNSSSAEKERKQASEKNLGFLPMGDMRLYKEDMSDEDEERYAFQENGRDSVYEGSSSSSNPSDTDGSSESDDLGEILSDTGFDEEVAEDYLERVGRNYEFLNSKWLVDQALGVSDIDSSFRSNSDESSEMLEGRALQNASQEYGMKKPRSKVFPSSPTAVNDGSLVLDDILLVKEPKAVSGKKKQAIWLPRSWLSEGQKNRNFRNGPGAKKKHRKETISLKRRARMMHRGVDLEQINSKLEQMVLNEVDVLSFQPMNSHDCSRVQRLASIYHLQSGCQGSGKKRFVTVTRTGHTCLPSSADKPCLEKLSGLNPPGSDQSVPRKSSKNSANHRCNSKSGGRKHSGKQSPMYANQPVLFVSSGIMHADVQEDMRTPDSNKNCSTDPENRVISSSSKLGAFEMHTKGFGSKMMAKMGFVEGGGLGRDGQGMVEPLEAIKWPKSLGLGVKFSKAIGTARSQPERIGAFEKHTKGSGSRMMERMGFVEGMGLGRDSQGIVTPLVAVRLPKSRGLGANA
uniref:Protein SQS1 n=1 Tax=Nelumbo nucifera TaxID=4432 RepID=A0A822ZJU9_NELNU|nr:TPA_asm: hypothetical protein HUJ06_003367 [Nelumbo nucifera]